MYGAAKMYYLDIMRPIKADKLTFNYNRVYNFLKRLDPDGSLYLENYDDVYSNGIGIALNEATNSLLDSCSSNWEVVCDVYGGYNGDMKHFCETVRKMLGDGVVYYDGAGGANYIVMTSGQIKLASNVSPRYGTTKVNEKYTLDENLFITVK